MCDVQEYLKLRIAHVTSLKAGGDSPYPHKFVVTISLADFIDNYGDVNDGEQHPDVVSVAGGNSFILFWFLFCFLSNVDIISRWLAIGIVMLSVCLYVCNTVVKNQCDWHMNAM